MMSDRRPPRARRGVAGAAALAALAVLAAGCLPGRSAHTAAGPVTTGSTAAKAGATTPDTTAPTSTYSSSTTNGPTTAPSTTTTPTAPPGTATTPGLALPAAVAPGTTTPAGVHGFPDLPTGSSGVSSARSGLPWPSGVFVPGGDPARYDGFAVWRGRALDIVTVWYDRWSWADLTDSWLPAAWEGTAATKVWGIPPFPEGVGGSLGACARGDYDARWRDLAGDLRAHGLDDESIIRLGWELNGDWYQWSAHDPAAYVGCWRRVVGAAESVAPALRWDWNVNAGPGQSVLDAAAAYPGDEWVDIVGINTYDNWPPACDATTFQANNLNARFRLAHWLDFARAHGKQLSVPEWGTHLIGQSGTRPCPDNPVYIAQMAEFFRANAGSIAYESYFNADDEDFRGSLHAPNQQPRASAAYLAAYQP
jgi:hypothetical protein